MGVADPQRESKDRSDPQRSRCRRVQRPLLRQRGEIGLQNRRASLHRRGARPFTEVELDLLQPDRDLVGRGDDSSSATRGHQGKACAITMGLLDTRVQHPHSHLLERLIPVPHGALPHLIDRLLESHSTPL